jgi:hypothetical protein
MKKQQIKKTNKSRLLILVCSVGLCVMFYDRDPKKDNASMGWDDANQRDANETKRKPYLYFNNDPTINCHWIFYERTQS